MGSSETTHPLALSLPFFSLSVTYSLIPSVFVYTYPFCRPKRHLDDWYHEARGRSPGKGEGGCLICCNFPACRHAHTNLLLPGSIPRFTVRGIPVRQPYHADECVHTSCTCMHRYHAWDAGNETNRCILLRRNLTPTHSLHHIATLDTTEERVSISLRTNTRATEKKR